MRKRSDTRCRHPEPCIDRLDYSLTEIHECPTLFARAFVMMVGFLPVCRSQSAIRFLITSSASQIGRASASATPPARGRVIRVGVIQNDAPNLQVVPRFGSPARAVGKRTIYPLQYATCRLERASGGSVLAREFRHFRPVDALAAERPCLRGRSTPRLLGPEGRKAPLPACRAGHRECRELCARKGQP